MKLIKQFAIASVFALFAAASAFAEIPSTKEMIDIQMLYAQYNQALDAGNAEAWADTFTPDGVFNKTNVGRAALITFAKNFYAQGGGFRRHWNTNLVLKDTSEGIDGSVYLTLWDVGNRPATIVVTGIYEDKLVKTKDGWRFKSRTVKPDPARPAAASAPAPAAPQTPAAPTGLQTK
jgi:hypothetical protein